MLARSLFFAALFALFAPRVDAAPLRIVISLDDEGTPGFNGQPFHNAGEAMPFVMRINADAHAVIDAAEKEGATEIVLDDTTSCVNLDDLPTNVRVITGIPRPLWMAQAMAGGVDAVLMIGMHASSRTGGAIFAHTLSAVRFFDVRLNNQHASESMLVAASAGIHNAPVIMASGDDKIIDEIHKTIDPNIVGVVVKKSLGFQSAEVWSPVEARKKIVEGVHTALQAFKAKSTKFSVYKLKSPVTIEMDVPDAILTESLSYLPMPGLEVLHGTTVKYTNNDFINVMKVLWFVARYNYGYPQPRIPGVPDKVQ